MFIVDTIENTSINRNRNRINLFVQTERSIDLLGINASITTENTDFSHQKSIPKNVISKNNINNTDKSFDINLKNDSQQTKNNKNMSIVSSNREEITKAPEKNRASSGRKGGVQGQRGPCGEGRGEVCG